MLFLFVVLWLTGALLLFTESKRASTYWASATAFCGGAGGLSVVIEERFLPFVIETYNHGFLEITLSIGEDIFSFVSHYLEVNDSEKGQDGVTLLLIGYRTKNEKVGNE